jgi:CubicO group peptidase (beta-lactamase class C family)
MNAMVSRRTVIAGSLALGAHAAAVWAGSGADPAGALGDVIDYVRGQATTGFLVIRDGRTWVERNWPAPADPQFRLFTYGTTADGALLEDVASQQKSFVAMLVAVALDKGLLDLAQPVSAVIGPGWSRADRAQEVQIRVIDVLTMSSGLKPDFTWQAPPGGTFLYNTPVYAVTKRIVAAAARQPLDQVTHDWLTAPAGMHDTAWRQRPAAFGDVGNPTGLVTSPRDTARFGQIVLDGGRVADGTRIVSAAQMRAMFSRSAANPSYGRLWWLNGGSYAIKPLGARSEGPLIPAAPADLVAALGALDRKLYIVPSRRLVVVRMGDTTPDRNFDQNLWLRLMAALPAT